jgi:3',5'-cyclic AMP phosphodiesterase CpdA
MSVLLHISDPHFGTEVAPVARALLALGRSLEPDLIVVSGDITQRARRAQFAAAHAFLTQLAPAGPLLVIPGNHDIPLFDLPSRLASPYASFARAFGTDLEPTYEADRLLVLCLNTTRWFRHKHGQVSDEQIDRTAARLRRARPEQLRVVVTHQPVHVLQQTDRNNLLRNHARAVRVWSDAGADIVMGGHIHLPYVCSLRDRLPDLRRNTWVVQAGTAVSKRIRDDVPNSVNVVRHADGSRCSVERWDYASTACEFRQVACTELSLSRAEALTGVQLPAAEDRARAGDGRDHPGSASG